MSANTTRAIGTILSLSTLIALSGCVAEMAAAQYALPVMGSPYERTAVPETKSVIYVYRPHQFAGMGLRTIISCANDSASLQIGAYHRFSVDPGSLVCSASSTPQGQLFGSPFVASPIQIDAKPGLDYYVKEEVEPGFWTPHISLVYVEQDGAQLEIAACKRQ